MFLGLEEYNFQCFPKYRVFFFQNNCKIHTGIQWSLKNNTIMLKKTDNTNQNGQRRTGYVVHNKVRVSLQFAELKELTYIVVKFWLSYR